MRIHEYKEFGIELVVPINVQLTPSALYYSCVSYKVLCCAIKCCMDEKRPKFGVSQHNLKFVRSFRTQTEKNITATTMPPKLPPRDSFPLPPPRPQTQKPPGRQQGPVAQHASKASVNERFSELFYASPLPKVQ